MEEIYCFLCEEMFGDKESHPKCPRNLQCGHTFCTKCLIDWSNKMTENYIKCPYCNQKGSENKNIKTIPVNRIIFSILAKNKLTKSTEMIDIEILEDNERKNIKPDYILKIVTLGDSGTGKTKISERFSSNKYDEESKPTIAIEFFSRILRLDRKIIKAFVWDTSGTEKFQSLVPTYVRGAQCVVFVFDIHERNSFNSLDTWLRFYENFNGFENSVGILFGNKNDFRKKKDVTNEEAINYAKSHKMIYFEGSAKSGENIEKAFQFLLRKYLRTIKNRKNNSTEKGLKIGKIKKIIGNYCCNNDF